MASPKNTNQGIDANPFIDSGVPDPLGLAPPTKPVQIQLSNQDGFGGKTASTEVALDRAAAETGMFPALGASFNSGDNWLNTTYKRYEREQIAPLPDKFYDADKFLQKNRQLIPQIYDTKFKLANNEAEAEAILSDMGQELRDQDMLQRRSKTHPIGTFTIQALTGIIDLDTPLAFISGGVAKAGKLGKLTTGALSGGASQAAAAGISYEAGTTGDWTMIPSAGLSGMVFGLAGASLSRKAGQAVDAVGAPRKPGEAGFITEKSLTAEEYANAAVSKTKDEFYEFTERGKVFEDRDIRSEVHVHDDVYGARRAADTELLAESAPATDGAKAPRAFKIEDLELRPDSVGENDHLPGFGPQGSVGAKNVATNPLDSITNSRSRQIISDATVWERSSGIPEDYADAYAGMAAKGEAGDFVAKQAYRFHETVVATGLATDFDRLWRSGSVVARRVAYDLMENASGILRNNRTASALQHHYEKALTGSFLPAYDTSFNLYARDTGRSWYEPITNSSLKHEFNSLVVQELNGRAFDPPGTVRPVHPAVKSAADAHDRWSALDIDIGKGRAGEGSIKGYENLKAYSGYMPQKWGSEKIEALIRTGRKPAEISAAIAETYRMQHAGMRPADAALWADAVVRRARSTGRGADTSLIGMLQSDGRGFLEDMLKANNMPAKEVDGLLARLTGAAEERGQAGHTKGRIDVDMRYTASNGIRMLDLFDTDLVRSVSRRARGTAGNAALARKGILSKMDRADIKEAILQEQAARGPSHSGARNAKEKVDDLIHEDKHLTPEDIDNLFSYFDAGPIGGGLSPMVSNIKKLTNLALLNGLGLTQMGETGAMMASVGIERWWDHAGSALKRSANDPKSVLVDELKHMNVLVPEDRLFRDDLNLDMSVKGTAQSELAMQVNNVLSTGQRIQGYVSGFYQVRNFQQRVAVTSAADKIMTNMKGLRYDLTNVRAADIGLDDKTFASIKKYVDNGTVEFKDGNLHKLNFDKWDPRTVEDFSLSLNRHVNQVVQKAMIGEGNILFHTDGIAAMFFHLKSFPLLALEKQTLRHLRIADNESLVTVFAGLATAATAYAAKQAISGNTQNLDSKKIALGAIGYSNMTGWLPMWSDPVMAMLGLNSMKFNSYAQGIDNNVMGIPAALTTMNRMANIPGAIGHIATGNMSNNDIRALQTTPLIGNAYGISAILNSMKIDHSKRKTVTPEPDVQDQNAQMPKVTEYAQ